MAYRAYRTPLMGSDASDFGEFYAVNLETRRGGATSKESHIAIFPVRAATEEARRFAMGWADMFVAKIMEDEA